VQRQLTDLIKWIQEGRLHPERVISHRMSLSHGAQAYRMFDKREDGVVKIVLSAA
jgi:threonine dehydrogenase-like Zn-dependent dehydrogenase